MNLVVVILCLFLWALWQMGWSRVGGGGGGASSLKMWKTECEYFLSGVPHLPARVNL